MDVLTQLTKEENKKNGRKGYGAWKAERVDSPNPYIYGTFLSKKKKHK